MSEIIQNYPQKMPAQMPQYIQMQQPPQGYGYPMYPNMAYMMPPQRAVKDEFVHQHKKNGLIERLYNGIKNLTGLGVGSKKAQQAVEKAESGEITEEEARKTIDKYRNSQHNSAQIVGDGVSILAALAVFFRSKEKLINGATEAIINEKHYKNRLSDGMIKFFDSELRKHQKNLKLANNKGKQLLFVAGLATLTGAFVKYLTLKLNRIGSQDKVKKKDFNNLATEFDRMQYKQAKKIRRREKRKESWHNFLSGGINGITTPLTAIGGGFIGAPLYIVTNMLNRYFVGNTVEKNKSFNGFVENLKQDAVTHGVLAAGVAVPILTKGRNLAAKSKVAFATARELADVKLTPSAYGGKSTYQELNDILLKDRESKIYSIMYHCENRGIDTDKAIKMLTDENIFALKFKQTSGDNSRLTAALKEDCPPTRCFKNDKGEWNFSNIQKFVTDNLGNYKVEKCLGVGTVAETYLAKGPDGKEVCLKVLKEGVDADKIAKDKQKFLDIIEKSGKTPKEIEYLKRNVEDLADGILKEVDFNNELNAAKELAKHTKMANVVKGIDVKNGIYIMEKADGISLDSLMNLHTAQNFKKAIESGNIFSIMGSVVSDLGDGVGKGRLMRLLEHADEKDYMKIVDQEIARIKARTPQFDDFNLSEEEIKFMINEYNQVLGEQLGRVDKNGKTIHADIHPGNIFIDLKALKSAVKKQNAVTKTLQESGYMEHVNGKIFTLIDTGNTIKQTAEQAIGAINLTSYVDKANYKDIAEYVLNGAVLPEGMTKQQALDGLSNTLKNHFTDLHTELGVMTNEEVLNLSAKIMREYNIIPSDTQLNMNKARNSAETSLKELEHALFNSRFSNMSVGNVAGAATDKIQLTSAYKKELARQEKANLKQMTLEQKRKVKNNPNMHKDTSREYWIYKLKQAKLSEEKPSNRRGMMGFLSGEGKEDLPPTKYTLSDLLVKKKDDLVDDFESIPEEVVEVATRAFDPKSIMDSIKFFNKDQLLEALDSCKVKDIKKLWDELHENPVLAKLVDSVTKLDESADFTNPEVKEKLVDGFLKLKELGIDLS